MPVLQEYGAFGLAGWVRPLLPSVFVIQGVLAQAPLFFPRQAAHHQPVRLVCPVDSEQMYFGASVDSVFSEWQAAGHHTWHVCITISKISMLSLQVLFFFAAAVGSGNFPGQQETGEDLY